MSSSNDPTLEFAARGVGFLGSLVSVLFGILAWIASLLTNFYVLAIIIVLTAVSIPLVRYSDTVVEEVEHFFRGVLWPVYRDKIRPVINYIRRIVNPLVCWFDAANWWAYGIVVEVAYPTFADCGPGMVFENLGKFVLAVFEDFVVNYFLAQKFYEGPCDFTNICNKWIAFWDSWLELSACTCSDMAILLQSLPIIPSPLFSKQWSDPQTWCFVGNLTNAVMELLAIVLRLVVQLLQAILSLIDPQSPYAQANFTRPNFYKFFDLLCQAGSCFVRSWENAIQRFWDNFVPFKFVFKDYFCILDTAFCFILKTVNWLLTFLIFIDRIVQYPAYPEWETLMKPLTIEGINILAPVTAWDPINLPVPLPRGNVLMTNYALNTSSPYTPTGHPNPLYGRMRLTECLCIFIDRTICDPADNNTACFSTGAAHILHDLDFCCLTNSIGTLLLDTVTFASEFTYHVTSGDELFLFFDRQPFTTVVALDLVPVVRCIVSILTLIPYVGVALQNLIGELARWIVSMVDFLIRVVVGLASLPYFLLSPGLAGVPEFLTKTNEALDFFVAIQQRVVAQTPDSLLNSLCLVLNTGFPIPPIPCPTCVTGGYIPLPPSAKRQIRTFGNDSPWTLAAEVMGWPEPETAYLVTPLIKYDNQVSSHFDPISLGKMIWANSANLVERGALPFPDHASVDRFVDEKRAAMYRRWNSKKRCDDLKAQEREDSINRPHVYRYNVLRGLYTCKEEVAQQWTDYSTNTAPPTNNHSARLTLGPTIPPLTECTASTECFDLCCVFRAVVILTIHTLEFAARFFNGFVQYQASVQGTVNDFPYFTGEFCSLATPKDCFESDLVTFVLDFFKVFTCLCRFLNLVVPVTPDNPRPDICCVIQRISELIACILMVIINAINALALGGQNQFAYFTQGFFYNDVSALFDVTLAVVECACVLIRAIFPLNYIPGLKQAIDFDICCAPMAVADTLVEILRAIILTIISLATITVTPQSFCYFRLDNNAPHFCGGTLDKIELIVRTDKIIDTFLPISDIGAANSCLVNCQKDQGIGGVVPCICQLFNTLIPWRAHPDLPVNCTLGPSLNCQNVDLCCAFVKVGVGLNQLLKFINRSIVALWQSWDGGLPEFFVHYVFCDEQAGAVPCGTQNDACAFTGLMPPTPNCNCGTFTCGKLQGVIDVLTDPQQGLISQCVCEVFGLLDDLLVLVFDAIGSHWLGCFCDRQNGTLRSGPFVAQQILTAILNFLRKFPLPCYWSPSGRTFTSIGCTGDPRFCTFTPCTPQVDPGCECVFAKQALTDVQNSWIYSFLGPTANAMCVSIGNLVCFVNALFFIPSNCLDVGKRFLGSTMRWGVELVFRIVTFIEGFVRQFTDPQPACVGINPMCGAPAAGQGSFAGVSPDPLGQIMTSLFTWPVDTFIGDSRVACSRICPKGIRFINDPVFQCSCWSASPATNALDIDGKSVWGNITFNGAPACTILNTPVTGPVAYTLSLKGVDGITGGVGAVFPVCSYFSDYFPGEPGYPGVCANYSLCRPDSLPTCGSAVGSTPVQIALSYMGPIDGQIQGLIRYIGCAIDGAAADCSPSNPGACIGLQITRPFLILNSIIWQLYGAIMRFIAATIVFLLGIFQLTGGCGCWDRADPLQGNATIRHRQGTGLDAGFCYACPDAHAQCINPVGTDPICEPHCPVFQNTSNIALGEILCVQHLINYANPALWPTSDPFALCSGFYEDLQATGACGNNTACIRDFKGHWAFGARTQVSCPTNFGLGISPGGKPYGCQFNQSGTVPLPPSLLTDTGRGSEENANPLVLCSFLTLIQKFLDTLNAFAAIFSTPIMIPDAKRDEPNKGPFATLGSFTGPKRRESRAQFYERIAPYKRIAYMELAPAALASDGRYRRVQVAHDEHNLTGVELLERRLKRRVMRDENFTSAPLDNTTNAMHGRTFYTHGGYDQTIPSMPELVLSALYDYDTSDCFVDPVACACRNFYMPQYCSWTMYQGVIANPYRKRVALRGKRQSVNATNSTELTPDEMFAIMTEVFTDQTVCDQAIVTRAEMEYDSMPHPYMERWVGCIDKRIQGERLAAVTNYVVPPNLMYSTQAPLTLFGNIVAGAREAVATNRAVNMERNKRKRSELDEAFPDMDRILFERAKEGRKIMQERFNIAPDSPIFEGMVQLDQVLYKYQTGFYTHLVKTAYRSVREGDWHWPSYEQGVHELDFAIRNLKDTFTNQPYREMVDGFASHADAVHRWTRDVVYNTGVMQTLRNIRRGYNDYFEMHRKRNEPRKQAALARWKQTPAYRWWSMQSTDNKGIFAPFLAHLQRAVQYKRTQWHSEPFNFWSADLRTRGVVDRVVQRWSNPVWTPEILDNWKRVGRVGYRLYDAVFPGTLTPLQRERILFDGNCVIMTRALDLTLKVVDYCVSDFVPNNNITRSLPLIGYLEQRAKRVTDTERYELVKPSDPDAWYRMRLKSKNATSSASFLRLHRGVYKRATMVNSIPGPGGFNFQDWLVEVISDLIGFLFDVNAESWIADAKAWIHNPNIDEADYPDVGLRYWLLFMIKCEFPDYLNCSKGIGLPYAMLWVSVGMLGAYVVGWFLLPPLIWIMTIIPAVFIWLALVGIIGLHYSPRCALLFPTMTGISVTVPMCGMDQLIAFTDAVITNCYSPSVIPPCMIAGGDICPADPNAFIDVFNCRLVGVSDGIQNLLFAGFMLFGNWFVDTAKFVGSSTIGLLWPGFNVYIDRTMDSFSMASDAQRCRQWWCFGITAPSMAAPLLVTALGVVFFGIVVPLLIGLGVSAIYLFQASPANSTLPGQDDEDEDNAWIGYKGAPQPLNEITPESVQRWLRYQ